MESLMVIVQAILTLFGALSAILVLRASIKGIFHIGAATHDWGRHFDPRKYSILNRAKFRATPLAIMILGGWAGHAVFSDLGWFLRKFGRADEYGEWMSYQEVLASGVGLPFGFWLAYSILVNSHKTWLAMLVERDIDPITWLDHELGLRVGGAS
jgi:hypothetical protein